MITERLEERLYRYLTHKMVETPGVQLHAIGGIETHVHIAVSLEPNILVSDWVGKLKGASSHYINHEVAAKALQWRAATASFRSARKTLNGWPITSITRKNTTEMARLTTASNDPLTTTAKAECRKGR